MKAVQRVALSDLALARPVTTGMALLALVLVGIIATFTLPLTFLPSEQAKRIEVRVDITRTSPEILEREVIRPMEEQVAGLPDLRRMRVSSGSWGVRMNLELEPGSDIDARKLELRERIERARGELPELVQRISVSSSSGPADEPVLELRVASDKRLETEYYLLEERIVRPLERIDGVARVELSGVQPHELEVALDVEAARRGGVPLDAVGGVVRSEATNRSLGVVRDGRQDTGIRDPQATATPRHYSALPVQRRATGTPAPSGTTVLDTEAAAATEADAVEPTATLRDTTRVGEVARVTLHPQEGRRGSRLNGRPAINVEVYADAGASVVDVSERVRSALDEMRADPSLGGIEVVVFFDQGEVIVNTLSDLRNTGIFGGFIGVFVLFGFLRRFQTTAIAAICIPMSVLGACAVLLFRGAEINCIVLLGLVLGIGMLIDNAVVIVEAIAARRQRGEPILHAAKHGAREVGLATIASTLSSVIVFLPLMLTEGNDTMYDYMRPLGATLVTALLASLLVSQTIVPLAMSRLPPTARERKERSAPADTPTTEPLAWLGSAYGVLVRWTIRRPLRSLMLGVALCATAAWPATQAAYDFDPQEQFVGLPIQLQFTGSVDKELVEARIIELEDALLPRKDELGIETMTCRFRDWGGNCDVRPSFDIESEREMSDFSDAITKALPELPGVRFRVGERDGWWRGGRDPREVQFVVRGEDMGTLLALSKQLETHLIERLPKGDPANPEAGGYDQIRGPFNEGSREIHVHLEPERLRRLGLSAEEVANAIGLGFQGVPLGSVRGTEGEVSLRLSAGPVDGDEGREPDIDELRQLRLETADGVEIQLGSIADFEVARSPWWLQRVDRATELRMTVRFFQPDPANRELVAEARRGFDFPPGYAAGEGTNWWDRDRDQWALVINLGLSLLLVYAVMASLFESFLQPLGIMVTCLLGCIGAPWAMWATGTTIDTVALIGLFILIGIVVNNGIMLIDKVTQLRSSGLSRADALERAGRERLRPILMTASTTFLGLVPMLVHHPTLAGVYYHSIAIIIAGGLVTSTVFTLVFLPAVYGTIEDLAIGARRHWKRFAR